MTSRSRAYARAAGLAALAALAACAAAPTRPIAPIAPIAPMARAAPATASRTASRTSPPERDPAPLSAGAVPPAGACPPRAPGEAVLAFAGDVIAQDAVKAAGAAHGWSSVLGAAADAVRGADLALVNVESPITERVVRSGDMIFHADESLLAALRAAGFDVASFANNHVYDQGRRGFTDSLAALERAGFVVAGAGPSLEAACRPQLVERRGIRVALLARTLVLNFDDHATDRDPSVCRLAEGPLKRRAREAREAGADLVVASLHWGNEYEHSPRDEQVDAAQRIVEAGVDLVIGHHPHVLQRVARVHVRDDRDALVAYSLGNLVSNQARDFDDGRSPAASGDARDGVVLRVAVHRRADGRVAIDRAVAIPLWTAHGDDGGGDGDGIAVVPAPPARARRVAAALGHDVATLDLARATCP